MIKAVVFDLDNTIYDEIDYYTEVLNLFSVEKKITPGLQSYIDYDLLHSSKDILGDVLKKAGIYSKALQEQLFSLYKIADVKIKPKEEAMQILQDLKDRSIKIGLITNGTVEAQKNKVRLLGIEHYFDMIVYAREFGKDKEKPHHTPFLYLLSNLDLKPEECIMVGDDISTDIRGAINVGMMPVLYESQNRKNQFFCSENFKVIKIKSLLEIIPILSKYGG